MQIQIIYLATLGMIFLDFVFRRYKIKSRLFVEKNDFLPYKIFLSNEGRPFQTWEDANNLPASKCIFGGLSNTPN